MKVEFYSKNLETETKDINEGELYHQIAEYISKSEAPDVINVDCPCGTAEYQLIKKGEAFFVKENYNTISISQTEPVPTVYLTMVNPQWNNYKFYKLEDCGNRNILATYGRIGADSNEMFGTRTHTYPKRMYFIKLLEKLNKGYKMNDAYLEETEETEIDDSEDVKEPDVETPAYQLISLLKSFATNYVQHTLTKTVVTQKMVDETKELLTQLYAITDDVEMFNNILLQILVLSPRKVSNVADLLAKGVSDFESIVNREDTLLMAMEAVVANHQPKHSRKPKIDDFNPNNIKIHIATEKQREEVLRHLNDNLKPKVKNIYRVIHPEHKKKFNEYLQEHNIKKVKQLWHGSRNENWLSILNNGLLLKPNAVITGKMLGNGIYFAPNSIKSWNYTSYYNTYWANGNSDTAFMGLYACAYGTPKDVTLPEQYDQNILDNEGFNCVHAHAGSYLRNDEIVFYNEAAMLLNYIVEFN